MITDLGSSLHGVSQVTHHHLGLVLLLVGAGQPAVSLKTHDNTSRRSQFDLQKKNRVCFPDDPNRKGTHVSCFVGKRPAGELTWINFSAT